ncbi:unnamed protein product [Rhizophagus irregularis]|nr:unnamed protein product [Rhizophagus irregularis]
MCTGDDLKRKFLDTLPPLISGRMKSWSCYNAIIAIRLKLYGCLEYKLWQVCAVKQLQINTIKPFILSCCRNLNAKNARKNLTS